MGGDRAEHPDPSPRGCSSSVNLRARLSGPDRGCELPAWSCGPTGSPSLLRFDRERALAELARRYLLRVRAGDRPRFRLLVRPAVARRPSRPLFRPRVRDRATVGGGARDDAPVLRRAISCGCRARAHVRMLCQLRHLPARLERPNISVARATTPAYVKEGGGGWIRPVVVEDGVVVGGWRSSRKSGRMEITLNLPRRERERLGSRDRCRDPGHRKVRGNARGRWVKGYRDPDDREGAGAGSDRNRDRAGGGADLVVAHPRGLGARPALLYWSCVHRRPAQAPGPAAALRHHARRARRARSGPPVPPVPDDPAQDARRARPAAAARDAPFVLRLNRFFWSDGEAGLRALPRRSPSATPTPGYLVELQVRYHPRARAGGRHRRLGRVRPRGGATASAATRASSASR